VIVNCVQFEDVLTDVLKTSLENNLLREDVLMHKVLTTILYNFNITLIYIAKIIHGVVMLL
jgi:hypothetical protein